MCASLLNAGTPPPPSLSPQTWPVRLFICDAEGRDKAVARPGGEQVQVVETDVVGPLCFQVCEECREGRGHATAHQVCEECREGRGHATTHQV